MKRDMDLVRAILLAIEKNEAVRVDGSKLLDTIRELAPSGSTWTGRQILEHLTMMEKEVGLIESKGDRTPIRLTFRLTWEGHEFIANARNEGVWREAKEKFKDVSFAVLKQGLVEMTKIATSG